MADRLVSDRRAVLMGLGVFGAAAAAPLALNAVQAKPALDPIARMDAATAEFVAAAKALDPTIVSFRRYNDLDTGACTFFLAEHSDGTTGEDQLLAADADRLLGHCDHAIP